MNDVIIRIIDSSNNVLGDLELANFNDFPLAINKGIVNLDNLKERTGTFTKTFKVPNTKNNSSLLSNVDNINTKKDFNDCLNRKPAVILVNNNPVEYGFVQVIKSQTNIINEYFELVFYGNNIDWVKNASELKINTILWTNNTEQYNQTTINTINNLNSSSTDLAYPYISRGGNEITDRTIFSDYRPCIYVKNLIEKSFNKIGYQVQSSFLATIDDLICDLDLRLAQKKSEIEGSKVRASVTNSSVSFGINAVKRIVYNNDTTAPNIDENNNYNPSTGEYTAPVSGKYQIVVFLDRFDLGSSVNNTGSLKVVKNGDNTVYFGSGTVLKTEALFIAQNPNPRVDPVFFGDKQFTFEVSLSQGDKVSTYITTTSNNNSSLSIDGGSFLKVQLVSEIAENDLFSVNTLIPDKFKFIDILNDFTRMFNIYYWTDVKSKTVYFEPRDDFFKSKINSIDWSEKLDISKGYEVDYVSSYKRNVNFKYKDDNSDEYLEEWQSLNKKIYGQYSHELPNRFTKGTTNISLDFFSATYAHKALEVSDIVGFTTLKIWNEYLVEGNTPESRITSYNPRIFFFKNAGQLSSNNYTRKIHVKSGANSAFQATIPYGVFETYYNIEPSINLNFTNGLKKDGTTKDIGLFERFYSKMFKNIEEGGRVIAYFNLSSNDIQNIDFRKLIYLENESNIKGYYLIEKIIDYNPINNDLTKVSLFKFEDLGSVTIDTNQTGNNDTNTDNGNSPPTLQPIYVESGNQLIEIFIENPITGNLEPVFK